MHVHKRKHPPIHTYTGPHTTHTHPTYAHKHTHTEEASAHATTTTQIQAPTTQWSNLNVHTDTHGVPYPPEVRGVRTRSQITILCQWSNKSLPICRQFLSWFPGARNQKVQF